MKKIYHWEAQKLENGNWKLGLSVEDKTPSYLQREFSSPKEIEKVLRSTKILFIQLIKKEGL